MRINEIKAELRKLRSELEFIEGQITNDQILGGKEELGELSAQESGQLLEKNEKLMTEIIVLETLLEVE